MRHRLKLGGVGATRTRVTHTRGGMRQRDWVIRSEGISSRGRRIGLAPHTDDRIDRSPSVAAFFTSAEVQNVQNIARLHICEGQLKPDESANVDITQTEWITALPEGVRTMSPRQV